MNNVFKVILLFVSTFVAALVGDCTLGVVAWRQAKVRWGYKHKEGLRYKKDPLYQWRFAKNLKEYKLHHHLHPSTLKMTLTTDKWGFRNVGRDASKATIALVGDSFLEPFWIEDKDSARTVWEKKRKQSILLYAVAGWSLENYKALIQHKVLKNPSLRHVVIGLYRNDWFPYYHSENKGRWKVIVSDKNETLEKAPPFQWTNPFTFQNVRNAWKGLELQQYGSACKPFWVRLSSKQRVYSKVTHFRSRYALPDTLRMLGEIHQELQAHKQQMSVLFIPSPAAFYAKEIHKLCPKKEAPWGYKFERKMWKGLKEVATSKGFQAYDLLPVLQKAKGNTKEPLYLSDDIHWSIAGNKAIGEWLAKTIR